MPNALLQAKGEQAKLNMFRATVVYVFSHSRTGRIQNPQEWPKSVNSRVPVGTRSKRIEKIRILDCTTKGVHRSPDGSLVPMPETLERLYFENGIEKPSKVRNTHIRPIRFPLKPRTEDRIDFGFFVRLRRQEYQSRINYIDLDFSEVNSPKLLRTSGPVSGPYSVAPLDAFGSPFQQFTGLGSRGF